MAQWVADQILDAKGLSCPMPILKTKKSINQMQSGQILELQATDPGTKNDLPAFLGRGGHQLLGEEQREGFVSYFVQKG
ncbi:MAG: sulfurtransferase TusA family protein [Pseudomonadota bacterium]